MSLKILEKAIREFILEAKKVLKPYIFGKFSVSISPKYKKNKPFYKITVYETRYCFSHY